MLQNAFSSFFRHVFFFHINFICFSINITALSALNTCTFSQFWHFILSYLTSFSPYPSIFWLEPAPITGEHYSEIVVWHHAKPTACLSVHTHLSCSSEENKLLSFPRCMSPYWAVLGCNLETHGNRPTWSVHSENKHKAHAVKDERKHGLVTQPEKNETR